MCIYRETWRQPDFSRTLAIIDPVLHHIAVFNIVLHANDSQDYVKRGQS